MKTQTIGYWLTTVLVAAAFAVGGVFDLMRPPQVLEIMAHLGYAGYVAAIIGFWKVLGAGAVLAPGLPRLKEWAYAGMFFDLTGAAVSHAMVGDGPGQVLTPLVLLVLVALSWALRPASRTFRVVLGSRGDAPRAESGSFASRTA